MIKITSQYYICTEADMNTFYNTSFINVKVILLNQTCFVLVYFVNTRRGVMIVIVCCYAKWRRKQQTSHCGPTLSQCWDIIKDAGPALILRCDNVSSWSEIVTKAIFPRGIIFCRVRYLEKYHAICKCTVRHHFRQNTALNEINPPTYIWPAIWLGYFRSVGGGGVRGLITLPELLILKNILEDRNPGFFLNFTSWTPPPLPTRKLCTSLYMTYHRFIFTHPLLSKGTAQ